MGIVQVALEYDQIKNMENGLKQYNFLNIHSYDLFYFLCIYMRFVKYSNYPI